MKEKPGTFGALVSGMADVKTLAVDSGALTTGLATLLMKKLVSKDGLTAMANVGSTLLAACPPFGTALAVALQVTTSLTNAVVEQAVETVVYGVDLRESMLLLCDLLDIKQCLAVMPKTHSLAPNLLKWIRYFQTKEAAAAEDLGQSGAVQELQENHKRADEDRAVASAELVQASRTVIR